MPRRRSERHHPCRFCICPKWASNGRLEGDPGVLASTKGMIAMSPIAKLWLAPAALAGLAGHAAAEDYPARTVKIVVPFGAGGLADIYARFLGQQLQESLKQSFVIEDRPG